MFVYHYFAEYRCSAGTVRLDGVITSDKKIIDYDGYSAIKREIAKGTHVEDTPSELTICALTLLHKF